MSGYYGDFRTGQTIRIRFNTVSTASVPTTLTSGAVIVSRDGADVTPSGGVTLTVDAGSVTGRHTVVIDTSVDTTTFTAGSEYAVRLSGSSAVGGTSVVGIVVGEFSLLNRSVLPDSSGQVKVQYGTATGQVNLTAGNLAGAVPSVTGAVGSVTGAVGSVTGNVGGNVIGSVGQIATGGIGTASFAAGAINAAAIATNAIDADALAADAVTEIQSGLMTSAGYTAPDNAGIAAIKAKTDNLPADPASNTQVNTRLATTGYTAPPTTTDIDTALSAAHGSGTWGASGGITITDVQTALTNQGYTTTRAPKLDNLDATVASRLATASYTAAPTVSAIWTEAVPGTFPAGSAGATLAAAGSAGDPWGTLLPGAYGAGTAGAILGGRLDVAVSSRSDYDGSDTTGTTTLLGLLTAGRAANLDNLDAPVSSRLADVEYVAPDNDTLATMAADYAQRDTAPTWWVAPPGDYQRQDVAVVLPATPPAVYVAPTVEEIDAALSAAHGEEAWGAAGALTAAAVWEYAGGRSLTDKDGFRLAGDGVDAVEVEAGVNLRQATSIIFAAEAGKTDGAATNLFTIFAGNHPEIERIRAAVTPDGERTTVQLTLPD